MITMQLYSFPVTNVVSGVMANAPVSVQGSIE